MSELFREAFRTYSAQQARTMLDELGKYAASRNPKDYTEADVRRLSDHEVNLIQRWVKSGMPGGDLAAAPDPGPSAGSIAEQLGLKLEPAKGQVETLVIDHIEQPSPN